MKIGDKVRFLSEVGGGRVAGFQGRNIVLVEDEDGFQVPMRVSEVVVIGDEDYDSGHMVEMKRRQQSSEPDSPEDAGEEDVEDDPSDRPVSFRAAPVERKGGDLLSAYLAVVPVNPKELSDTQLELYFVNDSNYYLRFVLAKGEGTRWTVVAEGEIEPNTKELLFEIERQEAQELEFCTLQAMAYKRERPYMQKPAINARLHLDPTDFYRLHAFRDNDFFEQKALVYTIIENDIQKLKL